MTAARRPVVVVTGAARGGGRWFTQQPASFTGHVLTFQRLREFGALPVRDTGGVDEP